MSDSKSPEAGPSSAAEPQTADSSFASLGVIPPLCEACDKLGFKKPTGIQEQAIPIALQDRDVIGLAQTGQGKTAAFALPILQALWDKPQPLFACVLAPTRELAYQISDQFHALGSGLGVRCAVIVGGMDNMAQAIALSKRPHIVVATPGRLEDHLANTKGFTLSSLKYLVMDEADRLLDMDFGPVIDKILKIIPRERRTMLFSATMTTKVGKLQRASLQNPVKVEVSSKYSTVDALLQHYLFMPFTQKDTYLIYLINEISGHSCIVFVRTVNDAQRLSTMMRMLGFSALPLHGQLSQSQRLGALTKFKAGGRSILVATDVASRGLDIPQVDYVVNYDIPTHSKDYIHRVGRTARAGKSGKAVTLVSQYDVELLQRIEGVVGKKMSEFPHDKEAIAILAERVGEASREAIREIKEQEASGGGGGKGKKRRKESERDEMDLGDDDEEGGSGPAGRKKHKSGKSKRRR